MPTSGVLKSGNFFFCANLVLSPSSPPPPHPLAMIHPPQASINFILFPNHFPPLPQKLTHFLKFLPTSVADQVNDTRKYSEEPQQEFATPDLF